MSQQHKAELLVTERNCQEFGEDESPSKMAEKQTQNLLSFLFVIQVMFVPGSSKKGIFLHLPVGKKLNVLGAGPAPSMKPHTASLEGACPRAATHKAWLWLLMSPASSIQLGVNCSFLAKLSVTSCTSQSLPYSLKKITAHAAPRRGKSPHNWYTLRKVHLNQQYGYLEHEGWPHLFRRAIG